MNNSSVADRSWQRFGQIFGARWVENFGPKANPEWAAMLDGLRPDQLRGAFSRVTTHQPPYPGWLPSLPEFRSFAHGIHAMPEKKPEPSKYSKWLCAVNGLFFRWMHREIADERRRVFTNGKPRSIPDHEMHARRAACRQLVDDFDGMEAEDPESVSHQKLAQAFAAHMRGIPVENGIA